MTQTHLAEAKKALIDFLVEPPAETEANLRKAVTKLAKELDVSYERALRFLLTGNR